MNMTNLLHRSSETATEVQPSVSDIRPETFSLDPPGDRHRSRWPVSARVLVAVLAVAALLGALGNAIAMTSSDDGSAERQLQDRVATLLQQRDQALDAGEALDTQIEALDAQIVVLRQQLQDAEAGNVDLSDRVAQLDAELAGLEAQADTLDAALQTANLRLLDAVAERDRLAALFPIEFDASLGVSGLAGDYDVDIEQIFSSGLGSWNPTRALDEMKISRTSEGWLRVEIPGVAEGGLFRAGGGLHAVANSTTVLPQHAGAVRSAQVTVTLFPAGYEIADDGTHAVFGAAGVITVQAPAVGDAPAALGFYSFELS